LFAIHSAFGEPEDLCDFINLAHELGLAVILDWVPNHLSGSSILTKFGNAGSQYFYTDHRVHTDYGPRLDYSKEEVRKYVKDSLLMWIADFHFDGIRVDSTGTMRTCQNQMILEAWTLLQECTDLIYHLGAHKYIIAEDLQGYDHINFVAGFHSQWDPGFFHTLYHTVKTPNDNDRNLSQLSNAVLTRYTGSAFSRIIYTENHDTIPENRENRLPIAISPHCIDDPKNHGFYAYRRTMIATTLLFSTPGIPMLLQGQEFFETACPNWPIPPTINWENRDKFSHIYDTYQKLVKLRTNTDGKTRGLSGSGIRIFHLNEIAKVMAIHRFERGGTGDDVIVVLNFSNKVFPSYKIGLPRPGKWHFRYQISSDKYDPVYGEKKKTECVETETGFYDGFFWAVSLELSNYDGLILSQDPNLLSSHKQTKKYHKLGRPKK